MDIANLKFTQTKFRRGYRQQDVDKFLDLAAANLALPPAERTLRREEVAWVRFQPTMFRAGYDEAEVDAFMDQLSIELGLPSPSERQDTPSSSTPPPLNTPPTSTPSVTSAPPTTAAGPADDFRPDPTF